MNLLSQTGWTMPSIFLMFHSGNNKTYCLQSFVHFLYMSVCHPVHACMSQPLLLYISYKINHCLNYLPLSCPIWEGTYQRGRTARESLWHSHLSQSVTLQALMYAIWYTLCLNTRSSPRQHIIMCNSLIIQRVITYHRELSYYWMSIVCCTFFFFLFHHQQIYLNVI